MSLHDQKTPVQDSTVVSGAWPVSYETAASSSSAIDRRTPSTGELSLIRLLRDQLKNTQQQLKIVTAKVDVALSKASLAKDAEEFLLGEIENLSKAMECKYACVDEKIFRDNMF
jgi:hypothetical protein